MTKRMLQLHRAHKVTKRTAPGIHPLICTGREYDFVNARGIHCHNSLPGKENEIVKWKWKFQKMYFGNRCFQINGAVPTENAASH